jgi:hypothetical protein
MKMNNIRIKVRKSENISRRSTFLLQVIGRIKIERNNHSENTAGYFLRAKGCVSPD